jgi:hypothetical protein
MIYLDDINAEESNVQKKKKFLIFCHDYNLFDYTISDNVGMIEKIIAIVADLKHILKNHPKLISLLEKIKEYVDSKDMNHVDYIQFLLLSIYLGILKSDFKLIEQGHDDFIKYLNSCLMSDGLFRDAMEHDCLGYQLKILENILKIIDSLKKFGFYHFDYIEYKTKNKSSIKMACQYLIDFLIMRKNHYRFLNSIFEEDRTNPEFGVKWEQTNDIRKVINNYSKYSNKIEYLYKKII